MWLAVALTIALPPGQSAQPSRLIAASWDQSTVMASVEAIASADESITDTAWDLINRDVPFVELQVAVTREAVPVVARKPGLVPADAGALPLSEALDLGWEPLTDALEQLRLPLSVVVRVTQEGSGAAAVNAVAKTGARSRVVFLATDLEVVRYAKNKIPESYVFWEADRAFGEDDIELLINRLVQCGADGVATTEKRIHPAMARTLRQRGYPLMALDVASGNTVARLRDLGVNILCTEEPADVRSDLSALAGQRPWHYDW